MWNTHSLFQQENPCLVSTQDGHLMASSYFSGDHHILLFTTALEGNVTEVDDSVSNLNFHYDLIESESEGEENRETDQTRAKDPRELHKIWYNKYPTTFDKDHPWPVTQRQTVRGKEIVTTIPSFFNLQKMGSEQLLKWFRKKNELAILKSTTEKMVLYLGGDLTLLNSGQ